MNEGMKMLQKLDEIEPLSREAIQLIGEVVTLNREIGLLYRKRTKDTFRTIKTIRQRLNNLIKIEKDNLMYKEKLMHKEKLIAILRDLGLEE